ncbi:MAG: SagB/ThcOx family dehydrogenase [Sedimentisphaerales bacterium]|nr:SagB/ThcOx family dehydrogenase [Sedimentisphaerales bacterium]
MINNEREEGVKMDGTGDRFQQETKYDPKKMPAHRLDWASKPELYKEYPKARRIELPAFEPDKPVSLDKTLRQRKSIRDYQDTPISKGQLAYLLWASTGIQRVEDGYEFRTTPSAGALYPIETYVVVNNVKALEAGVYHYAIQPHQLELLQQRDLRRQIAEAALGQGMCATAAAVFIWTAVFERCKWKYGQRAYRYIYLDAGHIAENLALAAVSLNLGTCEIGALYDESVNAIIGIDGTEESTICMATVGNPA